MGGGDKATNFCIRSLVFGRNFLIDRGERLSSGKGLIDVGCGMLDVGYRMLMSVELASGCGNVSQ